MLEETARLDIGAIETDHVAGGRALRLNNRILSDRVAGGNVLRHNNGEKDRGRNTQIDSKLGQLMPLVPRWRWRRRSGRIEQKGLSQTHVERTCCVATCPLPTVGFRHIVSSSVGDGTGGDGVTVLSASSSTLAVTSTPSLFSRPCKAVGGSRAVLLPEALLADEKRNHGRSGTSGKAG